MIQAIVALFTLVSSLVSRIFLFMAGGTAFTSLLQVALGFGVVKLLLAFSLSFITYQITDGLIDSLISVIQSSLDSINFGDSQINALVFDMIDTLGFDVGISIILSAVAFAFSLKAFGWATKMGA